MAITFGFYNSMNGDRKYDAVQISSIFDGVIRDGVFQSIGEYLSTKPGTGMQVIVSPGKAWFNHTWTINDAALPLDIEQADVTLKRYDAIILEVDSTKTVRENTIKVVKGTPASDPKKPQLTSTDDVHQYALAYILVNPGVTEIKSQDIEVNVGKDDCPFVTSILESVSIEALLEKWEGEFRAWFDELQDQMSGDVATNLQNQITRNAPKVGDIIISYNTEERGSQWLPANGSEYDTEKYSELFKHLSLSMDIRRSIPRVPNSSSVIFVENMAFYQKGTSNEDRSIFYPAKRLGSPDYSHPIDYAKYFIDETSKPPLANMSYGFANGKYFIFGARSGIIFLLHSSDGINWLEHTIKPDSSFGVYDKPNRSPGLYYMSGNYYLIVSATSGCSYLKVKDILSKSTYSMTELNEIYSWTQGTVFAYQNKDKNAIYIANSHYRADYIHKLTSSGVSTVSLGGETGGESCSEIAIYENGDAVECVSTFAGVYRRVTARGISTIPKDSNDDFVSAVGISESGTVCFIYKNKLYELKPTDNEFTPIGNIDFSYRVHSSNYLSYYPILNRSSSAFILDFEKNLLCGCSYWTYTYAGAITEYHGAHSNSPYITPPIATEYGEAYIRGES